MMKYEFILDKKALKFINRQDMRQRKRIYEAIYKLPHEGDIDTVKARKGFYRLRVGDFRIIYTVENDILTVYVVDIDSRGGIYKK